MKDLIFENEIAITAIIKNESRYISEWLDYHYRIGVDKFYIYDNDSEDREELLKILEPWIQNHIVDYKIFPGVCRQMPAYNDAIENHRFDCRYMAFIDLDEFIFVKIGQTLLEFLNDHFSKDPRISALGVNWRTFGTSGKQFYEPIDVTERFTFRAPDDYANHDAIKTIADPRKMLYFGDLHCAVYILDTYCYNENLNIVRSAGNADKTCDRIQLNHYLSKSVEEYEEKVSRGRADTGEIKTDKEGYKPELNAVEDTGLRDLYRQLKSKPLPMIKDHSETKILQNVKTMLEPFFDSNAPDEIFRGQTERFLTCFCLIEKINLLTDKEKSDVRNLILEYLLKSIKVTNLTVQGYAMLLNSWREIFAAHSKPAMKILNLIRGFMPSAIHWVEYWAKTDETFLLKNAQKDIEIVLNSAGMEDFNE